MHINTIVIAYLEDYKWLSFICIKHRFFFDMSKVYGPFQKPPFSIFAATKYNCLMERQPSSARIFRLVSLALFFYSSLFILMAYQRMAPDIFITILIWLKYITHNNNREDLSLETLHNELIPVNKDTRLDIRM